MERIKEKRASERDTEEGKDAMKRRSTCREWKE